MENNLKKGDWIIHTDYEDNYKIFEFIQYIDSEDTYKSALFKDVNDKMSVVLTTIYPDGSSRFKIIKTENNGESPNMDNAVALFKNELTHYDKLMINQSELVHRIYKIINAVTTNNQ